MPRSLIPGLLFLLVAAPSVSLADCKDNAICIDEIATGTDIELRARNLLDFPITYTVRFDGRYRSLDSITRTLGPGESERVAQVDIDEGGNRGRLRYRFRWTVGSQDLRHDDMHAYSLPYAPSKTYRVLQGYGSRFSHTGREEFAVDFDMPVGTPVHAARGGVVALVEESHSKGCWEDNCGKYANFVVVLHDDGTTGEYYHLDKDGALVEPGERIAQGQQIALSGNTGHTTMPHLHFAVYRAVAWGRTQSIAVRFRSADGIIDRPRRGARYVAAHESAPASGTR